MKTKVKNDNYAKALKKMEQEVNRAVNRVEVLKKLFDQIRKDSKDGFNN